MRPANSHHLGLTERVHVRLENKYNVIHTFFDTMLVSTTTVWHATQLRQTMVEKGRTALVASVKSKWFGAESESQFRKPMWQPKSIHGLSAIRSDPK